MLLLINSTTIEDVQLADGVSFHANHAHYESMHADVIEVMMTSGRDHHDTRVTAFMLPAVDNAAYQQVAAVLADVGQALCSHIAASLFNLLNIGRRSADLHEVIKEFMGKLTPNDLNMVDFAHTLAHDMYSSVLSQDLGIRKEDNHDHEQGTAETQHEESGQA